MKDFTISEDYGIVSTLKHKPTNVGKIVLKRQVRQFNSEASCSIDKFVFMGAKIVNHAGIRTIDLPIPHQKHCPLGYYALLVAMLQSILF